MICKQSWRGSSQALSLIFLFSSAFLYSMEIHSFIEGSHPEEIDRVWNKAPQTIKNWALELKEQKGNYKSLPYRLMMYGKPGIGKTDLALGIWRQNSDWQKVFISAGDIITKHRGGAAQKLRKKFDDIKEGIKTFIIIDESHVLMEGHSQEHKDTSETTEALKSFLDKHANNRNIMVVLTANYVDDIKSSMESRLFRFGVKIPNPTPDELCDTFHFYAQREDLAHEALTNAQLQELFKQGNLEVGRDIKYLAGCIKEYIRDSGYHGPLREYALDKTLLQNVLKLFMARKSDFGVGNEKLSDREFQEKWNKRSERNGKKFAAASILGSAAMYATGYAANAFKDKYEEQKAKEEDAKSDDVNNSDTHDENNNSDNFQDTRYAHAGYSYKRAFSGYVKFLEGCFKSLGGAGATVGGKAAATKGGLVTLKTTMAANPALTAGVIVGVVVIGGVLYYILAEDEEEPNTKKR